MNFKPKYLGMKAKDIYEIKEYENHIRGFDKNGYLIYWENNILEWKKYKYDKNCKRIYFESNYGEFMKYEDGKCIEYCDGRFYIDDELAYSTKSLTDIKLKDLKLMPLEDLPFN